MFGLFGFSTNPTPERVAYEAPETARPNDAAAPPRSAENAAPRAVRRSQARTENTDRAAKPDATAPRPGRAGGVRSDAPSSSATNLLRKFNMQARAGDRARPAWAVASARAVAAPAAACADVTAHTRARRMR